MKRLKTIAVLVLCLGFLFSTTSCVVLVKDDNGNHKGWFKHSHNPHHPNSTNPGKNKK